MVYRIVNTNEDSTELYHHGILGMRWGIRRFQPYLHGAHGKEVGEAARVKPRRKSLAARWRDKQRTKAKNIAAAENVTKANTKANRSKLEEYKSKEALRQAKAEAKIAKEVNKASMKQAKELSKPKKEKPGKPSKEEEYRNKLAEAINSGDARKVAKYKSGMSDREIQRAIDRINLENQLDYASNQQKMNKFQKFDRIAKYANTGANLTSSAVTIYNNLAGASNALRGTDLPLIRTSPPKEKSSSDSHGGSHHTSPHSGGTGNIPNNTHGGSHHNNNTHQIPDTTSTNIHGGSHHNNNTSGNQNGSASPSTQQSTTTSSSSGSHDSHHSVAPSHSYTYGGGNVNPNQFNISSGNTHTTSSGFSAPASSSSHTSTGHSGGISAVSRAQSANRMNAANLWAQSTSGHSRGSTQGIDQHHARESQYVANSPEHNYSYNQVHTTTPTRGTTTYHTSDGSSVADLLNRYMSATSSAGSDLDAYTNSLLNTPMSSGGKKKKK